MTRARRRGVPARAGPRWLSWWPPRPRAAPGVGRATVFRVFPAIRSGRVKVGGDTRQEFDAGLQHAAAVAGAVHPHDARGDHLPAVGERFAVAAEAHVYAERRADANR